MLHLETATSALPPPPPAPPREEQHRVPRVLISSPLHDPNLRGTVRHGQGATTPGLRTTCCAAPHGTAATAALGRDGDEPDSWSVAHGAMLPPPVLLDGDGTVPSSSQALGLSVCESVCVCVCVCVCGGVVWCVQGCVGRWRGHWGGGWGTMPQ